MIRHLDIIKYVRDIKLQIRNIANNLCNNAHMSHETNV